MPAEAPGLDLVLREARPRAMAALLRRFGDLDLAEEAFQDASLPALRAWDERGLPQSPTAWLVRVGASAAPDRLRREARLTALPKEAASETLGDPEERVAKALDHAAYGDDILRLLFTCCHSALRPVHQVALALRVVSGLSVGQIARAFLVADAAMERRLTRAKRAVRQAGVPFATPSRPERAERLLAVMRVIHLVFNEGYSAPFEGSADKGPLADEAIRLARLLAAIASDEPEAEGLLALLLLQHARLPARFDAERQVVLLEHQDRALWDQGLIAEGLSLAAGERLGRGRPGPYALQAVIAACHARAARALEAVEAVAAPLWSYFAFHAVRGRLLMDTGEAAEARAAFGRALALATTAAEAVQVRRYMGDLAALPRAAR